MKNTTSNTFSTTTTSKKANYLLLSVALAHLLGYGQDSLAVNDLPALSAFNASDSVMNAFVASFGEVVEADRIQFKTDLLTIGHAQLAPVFGHTKLREIVNQAELGQEAMKKFLIECTKIDKDLMSMMDIFLENAAEEPRSAMSQKRYVEKMSRFNRNPQTVADQKTAADALRIGLFDGLTNNADKRLAFENFQKIGAPKMPGVNSSGVGQVLFTEVTNIAQRRELEAKYKTAIFKAKYDAAADARILERLTTRADIEDAVNWFALSGNDTAAAREIETIHVGGFSNWNDKKAAILKLKAVDDFMTTHSVDGGTSTGSVAIDADELRRYLFAQSSLPSFTNEGALVDATATYLSTQLADIPSDLRAAWVADISARDGLLEWFTVNSGVYASLANYLASNVGSYNGSQALAVLKMAHAVYNGGTSLASGLSDADKAVLVANLVTDGLAPDDVIAAKNLVGASGSDEANLRARIKMADAVYSNGFAANLSSGTGADLVAKLVTDSISISALNAAKALVEVNASESKDDRAKRIELAVSVYNAGTSKAASLSAGEYAYDVVNELMELGVGMSDLTPANITSAIALVSNTSESAKDRALRIAAAVAVNEGGVNAADTGFVGVDFVDALRSVSGDGDIKLTAPQIAIIADFADKTGTSADRAAALKTLSGNYELAAGNAAGLIGFGADAAGKRALLAGYQGATSTVRGYFAAAFADTDHSVLNGLSVWSDVATAITNYNTASAKITEILGASDGTGADAPVTGAAARTVLANYVVASTDANNLISFGGTVAAKDLLLAGYQAASPTVRGYFAAAFADADHSVLNGLSVWSDVATAITNYNTASAKIAEILGASGGTGDDALVTGNAARTVLANYVVASTDANNLISFGATVAAKDLLLAGYQGATSTVRGYFAAAFADTDHSVLNGLSVWSDVATAITNYNTASAKITEILGASDGTGADAPVTGAAARTVLANYVVASTDANNLISFGGTVAAKDLLLAGYQAASPTVRGYFAAAFADADHSVLNGLSVWSDVATAITNYNTASAKITEILGASDGTGADAPVTGAAARTVLANYVVASTDANNLISFGATVAAKDLLLAGYQAASPTVRGYFAAAFADTDHSVLNGLSVWSDVATAITNYNTASAKITEILGASGGTGDDALVTGNAARTVLANYVVASTDANNLISFGGTVAAKDLLLAGYQAASPTVRGYFAAAFADADHSVLNGLSVWSDVATAITNYNTASAKITEILGASDGTGADAPVTGAAARTVLANYVVASTDANNLISFGGTVAAKDLLLAGYQGATSTVRGYFAAAFADTDHSVLNGLSVWSDVATAITNYNTASAKITEILGASGGTGDDALVTGNAARTVLANYVVASTDANNLISFGGTVAAKDLLLAGYQGATSTVRGYFAAAFADTDHSVLNGLSVWSDVATAITNYNTASAKITEILGASDGTGADAPVTGAAARTVLANYVVASTDANNLISFGGTVAAKDLLLAGYQGATSTVRGYFAAAFADTDHSVLNGLSVWSDVATAITNYNTASAKITEILGASGGTGDDALVTGNAARTVLANYVVASTDANNLISFGGTVAAKDLLLAGYQGATSTVRGYFAAAFADTDHSVLNGLSVWSDVATAITNYNTASAKIAEILGVSGGTGDDALVTGNAARTVLANYVVASTDANNLISFGGTVAAKDLLLAGYQGATSTVRGYFAAAFADTDHSVLNGLSVWSDVATAITNYNTASAKITEILGASDGTGADAPVTGAAARTVLANYVVASTDANNLISFGGTVAAKDLLLAGYQGATSTVRGYFAAAFADTDHSVLNGLSVWSDVATAITNYNTASAKITEILGASDGTGADAPVTGAAARTVLANYVVASTDANNLISFGGTVAAKDLLLAGYQAASPTVRGYFAAAFADADHSVLNGLSVWSDVATAITNYNTASAKITEILGASGGTGDDALVTGNAARTVLANYVVASTDANNLISFGGTVAAKDLLLAGYQGATSTVRGYFAAAFADTDHSVLNGLSVWSDVATAITNYNTASAKIAEILGVSGGTGDDALVTGNAARTVLANYVVASTDANNLISFGGTVAAKDLLLAGYQGATSTVRGYFAAAFADTDHSVLNGLSVWSDVATAITNYNTASAKITEILGASGGTGDDALVTGNAARTVLANYELAAGNAAGLIGFGADAAGKRALLAGYQGATSTVRGYFAAAFADTDHSVLNGLSVWSDVATAITNYNTASAKITEILGASGGTGDDALVTGNAARTVLANYVVASTDANNLISFGGTVAAKDLLLAGYQGATSTVRGYFAAAFADTDHSVLNGLSVWSDVATAITNYNTASAKITEILGASGGTGDDALVTGNAARTVLANYVVASTDANNLISFGGTVAAKDLLLAGYQGATSTVRGYFAAAFADTDHSVLNGLSVWSDVATAITNYNTASAKITEILGASGGTGDDALVTGNAARTVLANYVVASTDANNLISFGGTVAAKDLLLAGYQGATSTVRGYFAAAFADTDHSVLNGLSVWSDVATAITNYNTASAKIAEILGVSGGTGDDALVTGNAARTVLANYVVASTDANNLISFGGTVAAKDLLLAGYQGATSTVRGYFAAAFADTDHSVLNGLSVWSDVATAITNYNTASAKIAEILGVSGGTGDDALVTGNAARTVLANYVVASTDANNLISFGGTVAAKDLLLAGYQGATSTVRGYFAAAFADTDHSVLNGLSVWSDVATAITNYNTASAKITEILGASDGTGADAPVTGAAARTVLANYVVASTDANNLISFGGTVAAKDLLLAGYQGATSTVRGYFAAAFADTDHSVLNGLSVWSDVATAITNYNTASAKITEILGASGGTGDDALVTGNAARTVLANYVVASTDANNLISFGGTVAAKDLLLAGYQGATSTVRGYFAAAFADTDHSVLNGLSVWSDVATAITNYNTASAKITEILGASDGTGADAPVTGAAARTVLANYVVASTDANNLISFGGTVAAKDLLLAGYQGATSTVRGYFAAAFADTDHSVLNGLSVWSDVATAITNYNTASAKITEILGASGGTGDDALVTGNAARTVLANYVVASTDANNLISFGATVAAKDLLLAGYQGATSTVRGYFAAAFADTDHSVLNGLSVWSDVATAITNYHTASGDSNINAILGTGGSEVTESTARTVLANYAALASWSTSRGTLLGYMSTAADKRTALAYFVDATDGAARRAAFDDVSSIVSDAGSWAAIQPIVDHSDIHDALKDVQSISSVDHTFYDVLSGASISSADKRAVINNLVSLGFTNGDIGAIELAAIDASAMVLNADALSRSTYIALRIIGAFDYMISDSDANRQVLVGATSGGFANLKTAGDLARFDAHPLSAANTATYIGDVLAMETAIGFSGTSVGFDKPINSAAFSRRELIEELLVAGVPVSALKGTANVNIATGYDGNSMAMNTSVEQRAMHIALRAISIAVGGDGSFDSGPFGLSDSSAANKQVVVQAMSDNYLTSAQIYAKKDIFTFVSKTAADQAAYIVDVMNLDYALEMGGFYGLTISSAALSDANKKALIAAILGANKGASDIEGLAAPSTADHADQAALITYVLGL